LFFFQTVWLNPCQCMDQGRFTVVYMARCANHAHGWLAAAIAVLLVRGFPGHDPGCAPSSPGYLAGVQLCIAPLSLPFFLDLAQAVIAPLERHLHPLQPGLGRRREIAAVGLLQPPQMLDQRLMHLQVVVNRRKTLDHLTVILVLLGPKMLLAQFALAPLLLKVLASALHSRAAAP